MWDEAVPEMQGEVWVAAAQAGDEVILVSLDCLFCGVGVMKVSFFFFCFFFGPVSNVPKLSHYGVV